MPKSVSVKLGIQTLPLSKVVPGPFNPRNVSEYVGYIRCLADSIRDVGQLVPVLTRPHPTQAGVVELVEGQCRHEALKMLDQKEINVDVKDLTDDQAYALAFKCNWREDKECGISKAWRGASVKPIEEARKLREWMTVSKLSEHQVSKKLGCSVSWVAVRLMLLKEDKVADEVRAAVDGHMISKTVADEIGHTPIGVQPQLVEKAIKEELSHRDMKAIAKIIEAQPDKTGAILTMTADQIHSEIQKASEVKEVIDDQITTEPEKTAPSSEMFIVKCGCGKTTTLTVFWDAREIEGAERVTQT